MKNTILIVLFNYGNCLNNVGFIKSLYEKHFKQVIFYSDIPEIQDNDEVNFGGTRRGSSPIEFFTIFITITNIC